MRRSWAVALIVIVLAVGYCIGRAAVPPPAARASHVTEPTHPLSNVTLIIERYDTNEHIDCSGGYNAFPVAPAPGPGEAKLRIEPLLESISAWQGPVVGGENTGVPGHHDPSEHFSIGWDIQERYVPNPNKPNVFGWKSEVRTPWAHQNIPGFTESFQYNAAYATIEPGQPNGGAHHNFEPGVYRFRLDVLGDESGLHFTEFCGFTVI